MSQLVFSGLVRSGKSREMSDASEVLSGEKETLEGESHLHKSFLYYTPFSCCTISLIFRKLLFSPFGYFLSSFW